MSFTNNASNLTGKSTTNVFNVIADSLTVNKNTLCKGDLTVLGNTNIGSVSLEDATVDNLTVNNFTATNPVPISSGGTGLSTLGAPNHVLTVDPAGTALIYTIPGLVNPATITGTEFLGNPTLSLGLEADTGSLGRGFIRTGVAATSGLCLGTSQATVFRLWSNFPSDSNAEISNENANFTYNSSGTSGVFQVLNGGGSISFTNIGIGTISMATGAGAISLTTGAGATSITTGAGPISLTTGLGNISLTTAGAGIISIETATAGAINIGASVGLVNLYGSGITLGAPVIYIGTGSAVPVPSILTFACGAVNGITGAWAITTAAFQLNALSVTLNSTGTILLNNTSTINGNANIIGNVFANASNEQSTTAVNPGVLVYSSIGNNWGMDLGYKSSSGRFRTRMFAPIGGDIALSIGSGSSQSDFSDKLIVQGNTGNVQVIDGNILTNQNIVGGIEIINSGNLNLAATSPGTILIRGGSGSIITLPDASTLVVGYIYTINNNSNHAATVNYFNSGTLGSVPPLNAATISCIATNSGNGQWDIHITGPSSGTDWATPGEIGSAVPNTGVFTTLSATGNLYVNSENLTNTTNVNPAVTVFANGLTRYGMDLGYNATSSRYSTRIFAPDPASGGSGDIALSIGSGTTQAGYTDRLIVRGDTGTIEMNTPRVTVSDTLGVSGTLYGNWLNFANTTALNPAIYVFSYLADSYGMDYGYKLSTGRFRTRLFAPPGGDIALSIGSGSNQSDFSDKLIVNGTNGNIEVIQSLNVNSLSQTNTSSFNPSVTVFSDSGQNYGMDLGYNSTSTRYRTRIFAPVTNGDIALSIGTGATQASMTDHLIIRGDTGNTEINSPTTTVTGTKTEINGISITTTSSVFQVNNTTTTQLANINSCLAGFFQPNMATNQSVNLFFGKDLVNVNSAALQYFYNSQEESRSTTWGFANLANGGRIVLRPNSNFLEQVAILGRTRITGDLIVSGDINRNSCVEYSYSSNTQVLNNVWTGMDNLVISRSKGSFALTWVSQGVGFQNLTGRPVSVNVSFSCQRSSNAFGYTSIRILNSSTYLGYQDVSALDSVTIGANSILEPDETIKCQVYQNSGSTVDYHNVRITITTTVF